jgi:membrane-associated protease RseP (regulator of RpoE activity)
VQRAFRLWPLTFSAHFVMAESVGAIPPFIESPSSRRRSLALRPTTREWVRHSVLFLLTAATTTFAGIALATNNLEPDLPAPTSTVGWILFIPEFYLQTIKIYLSFAILNPRVLVQGLAFSGSLLTILLAHEMGHYIACRRYGVSATLPFFIPAPPLFIAGTFGAFIKIRAPIPTRSALFDIGLAGPLAGFVALLPIAVIGILSMGAPLTPTGHEIFFNDPLLLRLLGRVLGVRLDPYSPTNPCYMAAWIGLLVTSLNLMPVGQLDGGHGTFALFGLRAHHWIGRLAFVAMGSLAILGWFWHGSPSGFLYTVLLAVMLWVRHPQPQVMEPLGAKRIWIAILTLVVFALSFWPFPITIT